MNTYVTLLRGINVSGRNKIPMVRLKDVLTEIGLKEVATYIQSGNLVFKSDEKSAQILQDKIQDSIQGAFGFDVPVLVKSKADFEKIFNQNPYTDLKAIENKQVYFVLLQRLPSKENIATFQKEVFQNEDFIVKKGCIHLNCRNGYGRAKLNNNLVERKLKVEATTRNHRTMVQLIKMAEY